MKIVLLLVLSIILASSCEFNPDDGGSGGVITPIQTTPPSSGGTSGNSTGGISSDDVQCLVDDLTKCVNRRTDPPNNGGCAPGSVDAIPGGDYGATLDWIKDNLKGGGYKWGKYCSPKQNGGCPNQTGEERDSHCLAINRIVDGDSYNEDPSLLIPKTSHCAKASYIACLLMMKKNQSEKFNAEKEKFRCEKRPKKSGGRWYKYTQDYVDFANNITAWIKNNLGPENHRVIQARRIESSASSGIPKKGDLVSIYRKNRSGHSVIFDRIENGRLCYWSSNTGTQGMGAQCESISRFRNITVGSFQ